MKLLILFALTISTAFAYDILVVIAVPSKSHDHLAKGIVNALLNAGHHVTWVTPFPEKKEGKNLKIIDVSETRDLLNVMDMTSKDNADIEHVMMFARNISIMTYQNKDVREALVNNQYDAVVTEFFFSECDAGFAAVQQAPWILLSGVVWNPFMEYLMDDFRTMATIPNVMLDAGVPMTFYQRVQNVLMLVATNILRWRHTPAVIELYESGFGPIAKARGVTLPPFREAAHNISIALVNSHPSFSPANTLPPNAIEIAGYHIDENIPPLPKDLQDLLDFSTQGVVYFSMGSVVKSTSFPEKTKKEIVKVLGNLKQTVLWKFEDKFDNLPKNVHIRHWMPQSSILAHPNVKLFITHGGLLSNLEAIYHGVPLLSIPVFGDQPANAARCVRSGYAKMVKYGADMAPEVEVALNEMLSNDSYAKTAKFTSMLFRNRPVPQSKLISHYVELAIESKGAYHLRSKAYAYEWYERWMLDQLAALLAILAVLYLAIKKLFKLIISLLFSNEEKKDKRKHKKH